jgi:hypothetical protein
LNIISLGRTQEKAIMYRTRRLTADQRRGIILLVVLALLTLFAIVGISFVLYANSQATSSRYSRESESPVIPDMDPELLLASFLNQLIYDAPDDLGIYSAMRGHSLARSMYGYNSTNENGADLLYNTVPYNGTGRIWTQIGLPPSFTSVMMPDGQRLNDAHLINYQVFRNPNGTLVDGVKHDPERPGWRTDAQQPNVFTGGFNAPYTYPDLNNMYLGAVKAGPVLDQNGNQIAPAGTVLMPSFHRPWLFGAWDPNNPAGTPNWTNPHGKYLTLRPRPQEMGPGFPYPEDLGGDVKNLVGSPGSLVKDRNGNFQIANNDSFWMDLGAPIMIAGDGTKYKPLFAALIIDLDNRLNLNVHGNIRGKNPNNANGDKHASNQGFGPWEVNLGKVFNVPPPVDWTNTLFSGPPGSYVERGRYDPNSGGVPSTRFPPLNTALPGTGPHFYGPVDFDGCDETQQGAPSGKLVTRMNLTAWDPTAPTNDLVSFPRRPKGWDDGNNNERTNHPLLFNFFNPQKGNPATQFDTVFPISNMEAILRYGETNSPGLTSSLFRLVGTSFDPTNSQDTDKQAPVRRRGEVTTHSFGYGRAAMAPYWFSPTSEFLSWAVTDTAQPLNYYPKASTTTPMKFPQLPRNTVHVDSDFLTDWRSLSAALTKIDLNRDLTPYPVPPKVIPNPNVAFDPVLNPRTEYNTPAQIAQAQQALQDRQKFALDIYLRLVVATGAYHPYFNTAGPTLAQLQANRWLAQLAVNIVDYIDSDDIMTAFPWATFGNTNFLHGISSNSAEFPSNYVYGTELPRVVLNEVYAEYNWVRHTDMTHDLYQVDAWVELYNPLFRAPGNPLRACDYPGLTRTALQAAGELGDVFDPADEAANPPTISDPNQGFAPLQIQKSTGAFKNVYQLMITSNPSLASIRRTNNVKGQPDGVNYVGGTPTGFSTGNPPTPGLLKDAQGQACYVDDWGGTPATQKRRVIGPSGGIFQLDPTILTADYNTNPMNQGFYMAGSDQPFPSDGTPEPGYPGIPSLKTPRMSYQLTLPQGSTPDDPNQQPNIVLQRLANPYLPWDANVNPYITVDFIQAIDVQTAKKADGTTNGVTHRFSYGRKQPYYGHPGTQYLVKQLSPSGLPKLMHQPQHTFFRQNSFVNQATQLRPNNGDPTLELPFNWLTHLDRQLVSPLEILQVSAYRPHELLTMFNSQDLQPPNRGLNTHFAPWFDQQTRLYRVFEFLETNNRAAGVARGGRIPGLVNLNTVWDEEILQGLCSASAANDFNVNQDDVHNMFTSMMTSRTPGTIPGAMDRPFLGMGCGYSMSTNGGSIDAQHPLRGIGINDTFLRSNSPNADSTADGGQFGQRLFSLAAIKPVGGTHPNTNYQLLNKLFNNVTSRSNVFAVWVTVGFFQVTDETTRPVKLGAEIGKAENRHIRHRMFAIVDRTNLTQTTDTSGQIVPGGPPIFLSGQQVATETYGGRDHAVISVDGAELQGASLVGSYEGIPWSLYGNVNDPNNSTKISVLYGIDGASHTPLVNVQQPYTVEKVYGPMNTTPPRIVLNAPLSSFVPPGKLLISVPFGKPGSPNSNPGNPGPQQRFDPRSYPWVVRYFSIIN